MKKFEVSFPYFLEYPIKVVVKKIGILGFFGWLFQKFGRGLVRSDDIYISERIIEIPSVYLLLSRFAKTGDRILEIGHVNSSLALELANLDYQVTAIDIRGYPFKHQNLESIKGDFLLYDFGDRRFQAVISVSTIEHLGDNKRYGGREEGTSDLDQRALDKIAKLLAEDGKFILTVPYAAKTGDFWFKVYTRGSIERLLEQYFAIESGHYYFKKNNQWFRANSVRQDPDHPQDGVAVFLLSRN